MMNLNITDKYSDHEAECEVLTPESVQAVKNAACAMYVDYWNLTISQYFALTNGDFSVIELNGEPTIAQYYWMLGLEDFGDEFAKACKSVIVPKSLMRKFEEQARSACLKMTAQEAMLIFVRDYFGLRNFSEAGQITLMDYMIARRDTYNKTVAQRRLEQLQLADYKKAKK